MSIRQTFLNEDFKVNRPRELGSVPGLVYHTTNAGGQKYFSLIHKDTGKYLIKSIHVEKILPTIELANHVFRHYDFKKSPEELAKDNPHIQQAIELFKQEVERIHIPPEELEKKVKNPAKKTNAAAKKRPK
jgi:hypothetical protein